MSSKPKIDLGFLRNASESELRALEVPFVDDIITLSACMRALTDREHTYGSAAAAMSVAAMLAFNYVASVEGCTGAQADFARDDFYRRARRLEGPFCVISADDALFPQYDVADQSRRFLANHSVRKWLREKAAERLSKTDFYVDKSVTDHWKKLLEE